MTDHALSLQLRWWLWWMGWCERHRLSESRFYFWCARRALTCNRWRKP